MSCSARPTQRARLQRVVRLAEHAISPVGDAQQVADGADQRRLAGPVGAEQAEERARGDLEVEVLEGERAVVVALRQSAQVEGGVVPVHRFDVSDWPHTQGVPDDERVGSNP